MSAEPLKRILVIEAHEITVKTLGAVLTIENFDVETVASGSEGVQRARANAYDMIIVGADLPDMSGLDVMIRLRSAGVRAPIQFVSIRPRYDGSPPTLHLSACGLAAVPSHNSGSQENSHARTCD